MKLKNKHFSNILPLLFTASLISLTTAHAAKPPKKERWFEIEVILFNQLGDKNKLREAFPAQNEAVNLTKLPRYKRTIDLLTPYLYPDISTIKQQLPLCSSAITPQTVTTITPLSYVEQREQDATVFSPYQSKTLAQLALMPVQEEQTDEMLFEETSIDTDADTELNNEAAQVSDDENSLFNEPMQEIAQDLVQDLVQNDDIFVSQLTEEELVLIEQAELAFPSLNFAYQKVLTDKKLCRLPISFFVEQVGSNPNFNIDGYSVNKLRNTVDGIEDLYGSNPYLIAKDSLQLNDIVIQLRRSKNFRPLLHLGWREAPKGRNKAIAQRVFAGDNLAANFEQQQSAYQYAIEIERINNEIIIEKENTIAVQNDDLLTNILPEEALTNKSKEQLLEEQMQTVVQQRISQIINQAISDQANDEQTTTINENDLNELLSPVIPLELALASNNNESQKAMLPIKPTKPIQDWSLDGFFKVHLNHYLYITADFNIVNQTLAQAQTQALMPKSISNSELEKNELKSIRFEQNRRVISGEIHYFDHPYIGMIVQIRRYKQPEPEEETLEINQD